MRRALAISNLARTGLSLVAALLGSVAMAGPINFASRQVNIRAGVVITEANRYAGQVANDSPFVWYNISQNPLVKPAGWNFYNPHSQGRMPAIPTIPTTDPTANMYNRWVAISGANGGTSPVTPGQPLTKAMAGYWEVPITSAGDATISDYDVLYLPAYENLSLNAAERSRLRRFVDQGGVLWVDVADSTALDVANSVPLSFNSQLVAAGNATIVDSATQIFSFPNALTWLPDATPRNTLIPVNLAAAGFSNIVPELQSIGLEFGQYEVDATSLGQATVVTGRCGAGEIVITGRGTGSILNRAMNGASFNANVGFVALGGTPDTNASQVGLFAINLINLLNGSTQANQGSRKSNSEPVDNGGPLMQIWRDETQSGPMPTAQPLEYKGMTIVAGQNRVFAYSSVPGADLDQDSNPDDGLLDYAYGRTRDEIWQSVPLNGPLSAPAVVEVPTAGGGMIDEIAVVDGNGNLVTLNAFPLNPNGTFNTADNPVIQSYAGPTGSPITNPNMAAFGPTVHDGLIYVTDNMSTLIGGTTARVWVVDPSTGTYAGGAATAFAVGGVSSPVLQQASQGVTIGYIPIQDNSGGADCVAYLPTAPQQAGFGAATCGIASIWIATKGEQHPVGFDAANNLVVPTRASTNSRPVYTGGYGIDSLGIHVTLIDSNGNALTVAQMNSIFTAALPINNNGTFTFTLTGGGRGLMTALNVTTVSIDYHIDWDHTNAQVANAVRGSVQLPDDANRTKVILGNLALSPAGTLYAVEGDLGNSGSGGTNTGGMFYALREQGQGAFNVVTRFDLYDAFNMIVPSSTEVTLTGTPVATTFEDNDQTQSIPGASAFISGPFNALSFESGPSVMDGRVFVKARGYKKATFGYHVPCMVLLCFAAEPNTPSFTVPVLNGNFTVLQPDFNRSTDKTQPDVFTTITSNQLTYSAGLDHAKITLSSLASTNRGQMNQTLTESLPLIIQQPGRPDITVDPSRNGTWSPLQWYTVFYGLDPGTFAGASNPLPTTFDTGAPVITGNTVYAASNSFMPYIFQGINPLGKTPTGMIIGYNAAATGASDPFAVANVGRPYFTQLSQLKSVPSFTANPDMEWPLNSTAGSFTEYLQRMYQTVLDGANLANSPICFGLTAGKNCLFAYSNLGVYGYKKADVVVADEDRLASFDPSGEAQWSTNQTLYYNASLAAGTLSPGDSHPLVRPTRAYSIDANDYLVVDPGSNRMAWIDKAGHEIRSIDSFIVDPSFQPEGYTAGEPLRFNGPQDMLTFTEYVVQANNPFTDNSNPIEFWRHYVIADTGNHRFLELVDRYVVDVNTHQPTGVVAQNVLFYHSPSAESGKGYDYNGVSRLAIQPAKAGNPPLYVYAASMGTTEPTRVGNGLDLPVQQTIPTAASNPFQLNDARDGNGGIVVLSPSGTQVINQVAIPAIPAGVLYDPTTGLFNAQPIPAQYIKLGAVTSVTLSYYFPDTQPLGGQQLRIMCTTSSGVYEIAYANNPVVGVNNTPQDWVVQWMLPNSVYTQLRRDPFTNLPNQNLFLNPAQFRATFARRTGAGTVLITNGYVGSYQNAAGTPFAGEVLEVDGNTLGPGLARGFNWASPFFGFDALSIWYSLPSVSGARGIIAPIFADRR